MRRLLPAVLILAVACGKREPPEAPRAPEPQESARLQQLRTERAALAPNHRIGWVRSTFVL